MANWGARPGTLDEGRKRVMESLEHFTEVVPDVIIAKSIGTFALPWALEKGVAGVWLTPLLSDSDLTTALRGADDRHMAIGGVNTWVVT
jgi:hypothetical protein